MNLYEMTRAAASEVAHVRNPNLDAWRAAIDEVLIAAGDCTVGKDKIESLTVSDSMLQITTSYVLRGCEMENDISIPIEVVMAENPVKAANLFRVDNLLRDAKTELETAVNRVSSLSAEIRALEKEWDGISADEVVGV